MDPLTPEEQEYYELQKICYICKKPFIFDKENENYKNYKNVR